MITKVKLPKADANMNEGTVGKWIVREGDDIARGEPLLEIITDKTVFEMEAPASGVLRHIAAPENSVIPPGYVLGLIGGSQDKLPDIGKYNSRLMNSYLREKELAPEKEKKTEIPKISGSSHGGPVRATPSAKRLAREFQLELSEIRAIFDVEVVNEKTVREYIEKKNIKRN
jgi:pyruvate/2-oxoglutarate dehydrogenase complex dihydrolipoamide acyltransferase (E2) component